VLVDCRAIAGHANPHIEHSYYINSPAMAQDIGAVLNGVLPEAIDNRDFFERQRAYRIRMELGVTPT